MPISERLYVDKERLDSYFEQVSDPIRFDKIPVFRSAPGTLSAASEATRQGAGRSFTDVDKAQHLVQALNSKTGRHFDQLTLKQFGSVTFTAKRVAAAAARGGEIAVWIGRIEGDAVLFLCEKPTGSDKPAQRFSGYSTLAMLLEVDQRLKEVLPAPDREQRGFRSEEFAIEPISAFERNGFVCGPERHVDAFFRVRAVTGMPRAVFGYPVFIMAHPSPFAVVSA